MEVKNKRLRELFEKETGDDYWSDTNEACGTYSDEYVWWLENLVEKLVNGVEASYEPALHKHDVNESALSDNIELKLKQLTQELPSKTTVADKLYYEAGWREGAKYTKAILLHSR